MKDRTILPVEDSAREERNDIAGALRDVAMEKDESLALIDTILSRAPIGFAFLDREMRYVRINETLADLNGLSVEQHLGQTPHQIVPNLASILEPLVRGVLETGEPVVDYELRGETLAEPGEVKEWIASFYPVGIEGGEVVGVGVLVSDVTEHKKAEDELRENEYLLAVSQRITHQGSWVIELSDAGEWQKERWSDEHYRIFGFEPGEFEITDENFYKCVHPDDRERLAKAIGEALGKHKPFEIEHRIIRPDGSERVVLAMAELVLDTETRKPRKLVGSVQDITDRKRAEAELIASEERYRSVVETAPDVIVTIDDSSTICFVNPAAERIFGYGIDELKGESLQMLMPEYLRRLHEAGMKRYQETGVKHVPWEFVEATGLHKSGREIPITISFSEFVQNGRRFFTGIIRDITDRKRAMEALSASEERYRELVENALDIIYTHDLTGKYTSVNGVAETLTGFTKDEILVMNIADAIPEEELETAKKIIAAKLAGEEAPAHEVELRTKDGHGVMVEVNSRIVYENGVPVGVQGIARDITERKRAEARMRESDEKFHQLADHISDVFWIWSADMSKIYYISPAYEQIWGRKLKDDFADPDEWHEHILPQDRQRVKEAYAGLMRDRPEIEVDFRILWPDGEQRWVRARGFQVKDANGEVIRLAGIVTDITDKKQAESALLASEARYHSLFENMIEGYAYCQTIFEGDTLVDWVYTEVNGAFEGLTGMKDVVGKRISELIPGGREIHPEIFETYGRVALTGQTERFETYIEPLERWLAITLYSSDREHFVGVFDNITERNLAEAKLAALRERTEKRERMLTTMLSSMTDFAQIYDAEGRILFVNQPVLDLWGRTFDEVVGKTFHDLEYPVDLANKLLGQIEQVYRTKKPIKDETPYTAVDGTWGIYEYIFTPAIGPNGSVDFIVGSTRDVTERKRAQTLLAESQQRLSLATESASIGIWDLDLVKDTMKWDARMYDLYGNHDEDFSGSSHTWNFNLHPDDVERVYAEYAAVIAGSEEYHSEFRVVWPNGEVRHLESSATILRDESGTALHFIGVNWDITERKVAEETLREADQRAIREYGLLLTRVSKLALALGNARDLDTVFEELCGFALVSTGMDGLIISLFDANQKTRTAAYVWSEGVKVDAPSLPPMEMSKSPHSRAVLTGETIITDDYQSAMDGQPVVHLSGDLPQSSLVVPMSVMGKIVGGVEVQSNHLAAFTESHATALQMAANLAANAIENVRLLDNERVQAEQLRQSQKMEAIGVLAGGIAHDFNNLLTAINGFSDLTLRKMEPNNPFRHSIQEIGKAGRRAAELTSQLLTFSRKQVLVPSVINLNSVVSNIEAMLRRVIRESIELNVKLESKLGNIMADPGQIEQVIMNLAINARDAMPDGGHLTIETKNVYLDANYVEQHFMVSGGHFVRMTITDTGEGMDAKTRSHIFEPFFTTKEVGKGTGLGLATVYGIVKQSGGTVSVYSEVGHGSSFRVYLPCVDQEAERPSWPSEVEAVGAGTETILLVEDEDSVRSFVTEVLESSGYKVLPAENGPSALTLCQNYSEPIDLLISDVIMPKMGGAELKNRVVDLIPGIKVLFISGYTNDSMAGRGIDDRNLAFLEKPFTPDSLTRKVREVLEREVSN